MSELGETYEALRGLSQKKRARNRELSSALLKSKGITFTSHNNGAHLIVDGTIDFWPGTGKWKSRDGLYSGRGVKKLLELIKV